MLKKISPEQAVERRMRLINDMGMALLSDEHGAYPGNTPLYNALLSVFKLWKASEEAQVETWATAIEKSCGCL